jgi:hypothetical protein
MVVDRQKLQETYKGLSKNKSSLQNTGADLPITLMSKSFSNRTLPDFRPTVQQQTEMF